MAVVNEFVLERARLIQADALVRAQHAVSRDTIRVRELLEALNGVIVRDRFAFRDHIKGNEIGFVWVSDAFRVIEQLYQAHMLGLTDGVGIEQAQRTATVWQLIDKLGIARSLEARAIYRMSFRDTIRIAVSLYNFFSIEALDTIGAGDELAAFARGAVKIDEQIQIEPQLQPMLLMSVVVRDGVEIDAIDAIRMLFNPTLEEGIELKAGYLGPNGSFTTWAMNTRTGAVSEYADFTFNSFAKVGRRYVGASEDGLYSLLGDTDAGESIVSRIRGGFLQFGGTQLSRLKEAYIAARGEQEWVLRVLTGDGAVYNYRVTNRSMRSTKVHMGKGQRARYFAYELISAGADFDLDTLEFVPIVVQRRV